MHTIVCIVETPVINPATYTSHPHVEYDGQPEIGAADFDEDATDDS